MDQKSPESCPRCAPSLNQSTISNKSYPFPCQQLRSLRQHTPSPRRRSTPRTPCQQCSGPPVDLAPGASFFPRPLCALRRLSPPSHPSVDLLYPQPNPPPFALRGRSTGPPHTSDPKRSLGCSGSLGRDQPSTIATISSLLAAVPFAPLPGHQNFTHPPSHPSNRPHPPPNPLP